MVLIGVGQVGCSPNELAQRSPNGVACVEEINSAIRIFNAKLIDLVDEFNALDGAHFIYINGYGIFEDILRNPAANGEEHRSPAFIVISSNTYDTLLLVASRRGSVCFRVERDEQGMLRGGEEQWPDYMSALPSPVSEQG